MRVRGFTMIELLLVLALIALLASLVAPTLTGSVNRAREATLRENLLVMRKAIDAYYTDNGRYPPDLQALVAKRYIRQVPVDPLTEKGDTWMVVPAQDAVGGIDDVRSGSDLKASDGTAYREW